MYFDSPAKLCSFLVFATQGKPGSTLQMEFPNSPERHHPASTPSLFPAVSFSSSSTVNVMKTIQVESSTIVSTSLSKADVKGKLPSLKSQLGVRNSQTQDYVQRIETELTPKLTFSMTASLMQTSVSPTSEVTSTNSILSQVSDVGASSGFFQMHVASRHLQNNCSSDDTDTPTTVRVEEKSTLMLAKGISAINEENVVTTSILSASSSIHRTVQLVASMGVASSLTSELALSADIRASPTQTDHIWTKTVLASRVQKMSTTSAVASTTARTFQLAASQIISPLGVISEGASRTGVSQSKMQTDQMPAHTVLTSKAYKMLSSVPVAHNWASHFASLQGSLVSVASNVSSNVAMMSTVQIDLGQSWAQISRSASSSDLHVVTFSSLSTVTSIITNTLQSSTAWKPSFMQSKIADTNITSHGVSVYKVLHSSSHMLQSGIITLIPTNQSVHPQLSASAPVSVFISGMKFESSSSDLQSNQSHQDTYLIFNTSQVSTLPISRRSVPKSTSMPSITSSG